MNGKLFIGLTTKPSFSFRLQSELLNHFLSRLLRTKTTQLFLFLFIGTFIGQKSIPRNRNALPILSGLDGTRTRDPMRDRHVF